MTIKPFAVENARVTLKACALMLKIMAAHTHDSEMQQACEQMANEARTVANELPKGDLFGALK